MKLIDIQDKAKKFLSVNSYHPLVIYTMLISIFAVISILTVFFAMLVIWLIIFGIMLLLAFYIFSAPLKISLTDYYIRSYNQNTEERFVLFEGYKKPYFLRSILLRLINTGIGLLLTVFGIVPGIIYFVKTAYSYYLIKINPDISAMQAIRQSSRLMRGHGFKYFGFCMSFTAWYLACIVSLGLASVYVTPYFSTCKSIFFRNVLLNKEDDDPDYLNDVNTQISAVLNSEIENIERQIEMLEKQKVSSTNVQSSRTQQANIDSRKSMSKQNNPQRRNTVTNSTERLYMDEIGDIRGVLSGQDDVEEMVLPQVTAPGYSYGANPAEFDTREVEIMENESFEEFKARISKMRAARDEVRSKGQSNTKTVYNVENTVKPAKEPFRTISNVTSDKLFEKEKLDFELIEEDELQPVVISNTVSKEKTAITGAGDTGAGTTVPNPSKVSPTVKTEQTITKETEPLAEPSRKLTRAEILEKLKADREKRAAMNDKKE